jgi:hypothetical protein
MLFVLLHGIMAPCHMIVVFHNDAQQFYRFVGFGDIQDFTGFFAQFF